MSQAVVHLVVMTASYLVGSISWSYLAVRALGGGDLRGRGTGNLGARNAMRVVGPGWGLAVGLGDAAKGATGVLLARWLLGTAFGQWAALFFVLLGHCHSMFLGGAGGKGLAAGIGGMLLISPTALAASLAVGTVALVLGRSIYVMAAAAVLALPFIHVRLTGVDSELVPLLALVLLVLARHRRNLSEWLSSRR
ncbi:MAG: glycerol-3-phosphate acyltransferase [Bacillota bacterium]